MTSTLSPAVRRSRFAAAAWASLAAGVEAQPQEFDAATLDKLPAPARCYLVRALPDRVPLASVVVLGMEGEIRLGRRWFPFVADQILRAGAGFVWAPVVGRRMLRFVGADVLTAHDARMEFRLHGRLRLVDASGSDVRRSALGRAAAETVAWLPQALTPQMGARWRSLDDERAVVTLDVVGEPVDVEVVVDGDGALRSLGLNRWNASAKPPAFGPFGGSVGSTRAASNGVGIAGTGTVGWDWGTPRAAEGEFFRYRITAVTFDVPSVP